MAHMGIECRDCKHFSGDKDSSGRWKKKPGKCLFPVAWPKLPMIYRNANYPPTPFAVWFDMNAEGCGCFEERPL